MARNFKREYLKKIINTTAPNGYSFDLANYLHNPSYDYDYPSFRKEIAEDAETITVRRVFYMKHYDGSGEYKEEIFKFDKANQDTWQIVTNRTENILESANRFSLKKLLTFC